MTEGEPKAATMRVCGDVPPLMVRPQGWQVDNSLVALAVTWNSTDVVKGKQSVDLPAVSGMLDYTSKMR